MLLGGCAAPAVETSVSMPEVTAAPTPEPTPTPEEGRELWGFPIDDTHDAFEVPTGGKLGTVLVTGTRGFDDGLHLEIYAADDHLNPIQSIVVEDGMLGWTETVDINFDNYMDFGIMYSMGASNTYWRYWRWNEADGQFEEEPALAELCEPGFDGQTKLISSYVNYNVASGVQTYWQWAEDTLVLIRRIEIHRPEWEKEDVTQLLTVEDTINGELTEVYRETFGDPNDGKIYEEAEKWYDLDHHGE